MFLKAEHITKDFGGLRAVNDATLEVKRGEIVGLIGPNGAGKTTLFNVVTGFLPPTHGTIEFKDQDVTNIGSHKVAKLGMVRTFQLPFGFPQMSVWENMATAAPNHPGEGLLGALLNGKNVRSREEEITSQALTTLEDLGLLDRRNLLTGNLTGGELKVVEFARQLMQGPELMLLDEPASGVHPAAMDRVIKLIRSFRDQGITFLIVDHNLGFIMEIAERIYVMAQGGLVAEGTPEKIGKDPKVQQIYIGAS